MKNRLQPCSSLERPIPRRKFLAQTAAAASLTIVPRRVLGGINYVAPSDKLNIAFIGVGSQGFRVMLHFLQQPDVQGVAVCDPNKIGFNHPQWNTHEFANSVHKLLAVNSGWDWLSPDQSLQLTHSLRAPSGVSGREACQKIVNAYYGSQQRSGQYQGCAAYNDFRELLEKQHDLDAVVVCTTDNLHATVSAAAMRKRKHVFCQKPLTHTIYEARRLAEIARETGVATQIAVANQASEDTRSLCEWIWAGAIGPVREVLNWSSRPFWPQGLERPAQAEPVPEGLDWDLWLGPAPERPFNRAYLPFVWRGWSDFGCGALGDMGSYSFDTIFRVLKLENDEGLLFIGDRGKILCSFHGGSPRLIPESKMKTFVPPPKTLPRSPGNEREWLDACKGSKTKPGGNFEFSGMVTETLLLGNAATMLGGRLDWDRSNLKVTNSGQAEKFIRPERRSHWEL